jgi:hypothetical protein
MIKRAFMWIVYFLVCGTVIAMAIHAGKNLDHCHECENTFYVKSTRP